MSDCGAEVWLSGNDHLRCELQADHIERGEPHCAWHNTGNGEAVVRWFARPAKDEQ